jgi:hypothetical protein
MDGSKTEGNFSVMIPRFLCTSAFLMFSNKGCSVKKFRKIRGFFSADSRCVDKEGRCKSALLNSLLFFIRSLACKTRKVSWGKRSHKKGRICEERIEVDFPGMIHALKMSII